MYCEIVPTEGELRLWDKTGSAYGDPYYLFLKVLWRDKETVELRGLTEKINKEHWTSIIEACERLGVRRIVMKRIRFGVEREHFVKVF